MQNTNLESIKSTLTEVEGALETLGSHINRLGYASEWLASDVNNEKYPALSLKMIKELSESELPHELNIIGSQIDELVNELFIHPEAIELKDAINKAKAEIKAITLDDKKPKTWKDLPLHHRTMIAINIIVKKSGDLRSLYLCLNSDPLNQDLMNVYGYTVDQEYGQDVEQLKLVYSLSKRETLSLEQFNEMLSLMYGEPVIYDLINDVNDDSVVPFLVCDEKPTVKYLTQEELVTFLLLHGYEISQSEDQKENDLISVSNEGKEVELYFDQGYTTQTLKDELSVLE